MLWKLSSCILIPFLFTRRCFARTWFFDNNLFSCVTSYWVEAASSWRKFMLTVNSTLQLLPSTFPALGIPLEISIPAPLTAGWKLYYSHLESKPTLIWSSTYLPYVPEIKILIYGRVKYSLFFLGSDFVIGNLKWSFLHSTVQWAPVQSAIIHGAKQEYFSVFPNLDRINK